MSNVDGWVLGGCSEAVGHPWAYVDRRAWGGLPAQVVAVDDGGCPTRLLARVRAEPGPLGQAAGAEPVVVGGVAGQDDPGVRISPPADSWPWSLVMVGWIEVVRARRVGGVAGVAAGVRLAG